MCLGVLYIHMIEGQDRILPLRMSRGRGAIAGIE
jgi:hypothetical protein